MKNNNFILFSGRAHPDLAGKIVEKLGVELGRCRIESFPDGEVSVDLQQPVRGCAVYLLQPTSPPINDHLVELPVETVSISALLAQAVRRLELHESFSDLFGSPTHES